MTRATTIAVTGVLALAVSGLSVPAASAGDSELIEVKGGYGLFADGGDLLRAVDQRRDGYGVRARLGFSGTSATATAQGVGELQDNDLNVREGAKVWLQVCYTKKGVDVKCSQFQRGTA